jgi:hypothetical protein
MTQQGYAMLRVEKVKVLVVGFQNVANPIVNNVRKYDCEVAWTNADKSTFDKDAEIVIIAEQCVNRDKAKAVKEHYYGGSTLLYSYKGFSDVRDAFHKALLTAKEELANKGAMVKQSQSAPFNTPKIVEEKPALQLVEKPQGKKVYDRDKVVAVITECKKNNMKHREIAEYLNLECWLRQDGKSFQETDVAYYVKRYYNETKPTVSPVKVAPVELSKPTLVTAPNNQLELISKVIESRSLTSNEKVELIAKINKGEVKAIEWTERKVIGDTLHIIQRNAMISESSSPKVSLTKTQCKLVLFNIAQINDFVKQP